RGAAQEFLEGIWKLNGPLLLTVKRGGEAREIAFQPKQGCQTGVYMPAEDITNAYADGKNIFVTTSMMELFSTDEEMALVIAHEIAHNAMGHIRKKTNNMRVGVVGGLLLDVLAAATLGVDTQGGFTDLGARAGIMSYTQAFETEADYVGMYMMARAGFDVEGVEAFWRTMAVNNPTSIRVAVTHPTSAERFVTIGKTGDEIAAKLASGEALVPAFVASNSSPVIGSEVNEPTSALQ
ncbi:MAG: M48 family metallopeptidase, partial [Pseudomonadota bacterium]